MKKIKVKKFVVPAIYTFAILCFGTSMYLIEKAVDNHRFKGNQVMEYVDKEIVTDNEYVPVVNEVPTIMKPYLNDNVTVNKKFYDYNADSSNQEEAIIFYENTYIQNSGIAYKLDETFDVISILDGTVIEITDNEILGKTVKIRHDNDLISVYQSLSEITVNKDDVVTRGQIIGKSGNCKIYNKDSNLHFELYYQGKNVNPEEYYNRTIDEL